MDFSQNQFLLISESCFIVYSIPKDHFEYLCINVIYIDGSRSFSGRKDFNMFFVQRYRPKFKKN